jgi:hypothetical protein
LLNTGLRIARMALLAESTGLAFANPYKNPYESEFSPTFTKLERPLSGSSTEHSQYNEKDDWDLEEVYAKKEKDEEKYKQDVREQALPFQNITAPDALRTLSIHHPSWWCRKDMIVKDDGGKTIYFADVARYTRAPDITLHRGENTGHPIAAITRFRFSRHLRIGLGDPADGPSMVWEEMKNMKKFGHSLYRVEVTNDEPVGGEIGVVHNCSRQRRAILFQRTRAKEDGVISKLSCMNYKLMDEVTGEVLAVCVGTGFKTWKHRATLHIKSHFLASDAEVLVVLGLCGLIEKKWRRDARNSSGG